MKQLDLLVIESALKWLAAGETIWLCTVLRTYGSAPRSPGALFAANSRGEYVGSLSGGCIEEDLLVKLKENWFQKKSEIIIYGEMSDHFRPNRQLPCGGTIDVLLERLEPAEANTIYLQAMMQAFTGKGELLKEVKLGESARLLPVSREQLPAGINEVNGVITLPLEAENRILIAGISAVALYTIDFATTLGFKVIVADDRQEELRQLESSPLIERVTLLKTFPATYLENEGASAQTAILSLTHDPRIDDFTMIAALETPAFYIGAMGSKRNSENRLARLRECTDYEEADLARIHAPIGLPIGSKTPAEIALAIVADIVRVKNGISL
ncbi:hypothetical protein GCM10007161_12750 [Ignatzschineria indica]|uniref:XshC-Cox1 family protein n=1 Tax=Ignatzschineria indica TaxID=472583 RepID=A0A2U2AJV3_9GAMM|nr:XdhC family protein [Ignatzschineria indica]PWD83115.1 hypothetical protein DC082_06775 [Ignatzschineria indica]GGZ82789.1 hypothetical protein GCM10007161_12750 [Ignatzschineria indica]